jgi:hypothetical protein
VGATVVHHRNEDKYDDSDGNLVPLCMTCHSSLHAASGPTPQIGTDGWPIEDSADPLGLYADLRKRKKALKPSGGASEP